MDGGVLHARQPQAGKRLLASGLLVHKPEDKLALTSGTLGFNMDGSLFYRGVFNSPLDVQNFKYPIDGAVNKSISPDLYSYNFDYVNLLVLPMDR